MHQRALLTLGCALLQLFLVSDVNAKGAKFLCDCYLQKLQNLKLTWQAGRNFYAGTTLEDMRKLYGSSRSLMNARSVLPSSDATMHVYGKSSNQLLPDSFDSREQWPFCNDTISDVKDTGFCAAHWAVAVTQALGDRICIHSGGKKKIQLSATHLLQCCKTCGSGCMGGYPYQAWKFIEAYGIVTGGDYGSNKGCKPYPFESPCNYITRPFCKRWLKKPPTFDCPNMYECYNKLDKQTPQNFTIELVRKIPNSDEFTQAWTSEFIKQEILSNGPVTATMRLYDDFFSYKSGIYSPSKIAKKLDDVTVRIIGWGKQNRLQYWLGAVVWGKNFGDNGFVKIRMGTSALQIDRRMHSGIPQL